MQQFLLYQHKAHRGKPGLARKSTLGLIRAAGAALKALR
jgi:hypothetical protein